QAARNRSSGIGNAPTSGQRPFRHFVECLQIYRCRKGEGLVIRDGEIPLIGLQSYYVVRPDDLQSIDRDLGQKRGDLIGRRKPRKGEVHSRPNVLTIEEYFDRIPVHKGVALIDDNLD